MSFIRFIQQADCPVDAQWTDNPEKAFLKASLQDKSFFVLDQAITLSYMDYLYGHEHTALVSEYRKHFIQWYLDELKYCINAEKDDSATKIPRIAYMAASGLLGLSSMSVSLEDCQPILESRSEGVPCSADVSFYEPYLRFREKIATLSSYVDSEAMHQTRSFTVGREVSLPSMKIIGHLIITRFEIRFQSYSFQYKNIKDLLEMNMEIDSIFTYLVGYNWSGKNTTNVLGVLAAQCLTHDVNAMPVSSMMRGYLELYHIVVPQTTRPGFRSTSVSAPSDTIQQRRKILQFLVYIRKRYHTVFDDTKFVADYAANLETEHDRQMKLYLLEPDPANISSEAYAVFKRSRLADFEEFSLETKTKNLKRSRAWRNANGTDARKDNQDDPDDEDNPSGEKRKETTPSNPDDDAHAELTALESPTGKQDSPGGTDPEGDDTGTDTPDDTPADENTEQDPATTPDENASDTPPETEAEELPPLPKVSDKKGIKLVLSKNESFDTVLYREELRAYIDAILAKPPSYLSVQTIAAIKCLKTNWLYLLDVQNVHDFLEAMIKLPKTLKVKK